MASVNTVFFGTPDFAVPTLRAVAELTNVRLCVCQPDRPKGRGMRSSAPPVKCAAQSLGIEVVQPARMRCPDFERQLRGVSPTLAVVVAYGKILPRSVLEIPTMGCLNVHASLLPRWRGASPIQHAIRAGDAETGVTLMLLDEGMDSGPTIAQRATEIRPMESAGDLSDRLSMLGAELFRDSVFDYLEGRVTPVPQPEQGVSYAPMLNKSDGLVPWPLSAREVVNHVRGMTPWPGAFSFLRGERIRLVRVEIASVGARAHGKRGEIVRADRGGLEVSCGDGGAVRILELQRPGKRAVDAPAFLSGSRLDVGVCFEDEVR